MYRLQIKQVRLFLHIYEAEIWKKASNFSETAILNERKLTGT